MIHAVTRSFMFWRRTENPRVGGSIPSLATRSKTKADKRLNRQIARAGVIPMFGGKRGDTARVCASTSIVAERHFPGDAMVWA
jgi:hypothetical protein